MLLRSFYKFFQYNDLLYSHKIASICRPSDFPALCRSVAFPWTIVNFMFERGQSASVSSHSAWVQMDIVNPVFKLLEGTDNNSIAIIQHSACDTHTHTFVNYIIGRLCAQWIEQIICSLRCKMCVDGYTFSISLTANLCCTISWEWCERERGRG